MKKGRCSNNAESCSNAASGILLPYAGLDSICPECSSPLALVATSSTNANTNTQVNTQPSQQYKTNNYSNYEPEQYSQKSSNKAFNFVAGLALFLIVSAIAFFGLKYFFANDSEMQTMEEATTQGATGFEILNPYKIARANNILDVKSSADDNANSIASVPLGTVVDVTELGQINGVNWARINVPNQSNLNGYVHADQLVSLTGGVGFGLDGTITEAPAAPVVSEILPIASRQVWIKAEKANIRSDVGANSPKLGVAKLGDSLTIDAQKTIDGTVWYRGTFQSGLSGWLSSSLISDVKIETNPEVLEADAASAAAKNEINIGSNIVVTSAKTNIYSSASESPDNIDAEVTRGMVLNVTEVIESNGVIWYKVNSNRLGVNGYLKSNNVKAVE